MRRFLQLTLLLPCVSLDNSTNVREGDQSAGWMNFPSSLVPSQTNDNEGVNLAVLGTRMMTVSMWKQFENTLDCWTSPEGQWVKTLNASTRLISFKDEEIKRPTHLRTKIYDRCGKIDERTDLDYWWVPPNKDSSTCSSWPAVPSDATLRNMCMILEGRTLIFMGDSLSQHLWETLVTAFGNRSDSSCYEKDKSNKNHDVAIFEQDYEYQCKQMELIPFKTVFIKQPYLTHFTHGQGTKNPPFIKKYLKKYDAETKNGAVVMLNYGAMYVFDNVLAKAVRNVILPYFSNELKNTQLIYRASTMAHQVPCNKKKPSNDLITPSSNVHHLDWHWEKFPRQSEIWKKFIDRSNFMVNDSNSSKYVSNKGIVFLNVLPMMSKARYAHCDAQMDCLHYCVPGPLDAVIGLLYATLRILKEMSFLPGNK